ncbi:DinB family protein [Nocardioides sp. TRM66260-LWL]|uniref:DinB family protein n=1 Tax=Nocardioides sp. TRM66260-LWL TaxID=2874478 RepID=UPI001CC4A00A|nr:DinB family protein [Nocardioides sp. TRM66260-LWL]MBZ5735600.1 DinB family protein [Nocardioides sp. TRM66260-LWL]
MSEQHVPEAIATALTEADAALERLDAALATLGDGDLHRAHRDGGWTIAQVVSHISMCAILWLGDLKRLENDPELDFVFREEVGHDLVGYPQSTIELARRQVASTRRTLATAGGSAGPDVLARTVTIPDLGTMTIEEWSPLIIGHAAGHAEQAFEIMRDRELLAVGAGDAIDGSADSGADA